MKVKISLCNAIYRQSVNIFILYFFRKRITTTVATENYQVRKSLNNTSKQESKTGKVSIQDNFDAHFHL